MILVGNGRLISQDSLNPYMEDGCVVINDNLIEDIGTTEEMKAKYPVHEFIDAGKKIIMPGLINSHMHIYSSFARGMAVPGKPSENFLEILTIYGGDLTNSLHWKIQNTVHMQRI